MASGEDEFAKRLRLDHLYIRPSATQVFQAKGARASSRISANPQRRKSGLRRRVAIKTYKLLSGLHPLDRFAARHIKLNPGSDRGGHRGLNWISKLYKLVSELGGGALARILRCGRLLSGGWEILIPSYNC